MNTIQARMAIVFDEWAARYAEKPDEFMEVLTDEGKPVEGYGACCALYFDRLARELDAAGRLPVLPAGTDVERTLRLLTDEAIDSAAPKDFPLDAINWGDLCCVSVYAEGEGYVVEIEEASPNCPAFQEYIAEYLAGRGYPGVTVRTEW